MGQKAGEKWTVAAALQPTFLLPPRLQGDKLASGATWTRDEVAKGFESLGNSINALGQKIGSSKK